MQFDRLKRREVITLLGGAAAWPLAAQAQQPAQRPIIGYLGVATLSAESQRVAAFMQRLHQLGWIEGNNIAVEFRWAEGRTERAAEIAAEFVRLKVDIVVTAGNSQVLALKQATRTIPIIFAVAGDPSGSSTAWHGRAATSLACRFFRSTLRASDSKSCARSFPVFADWRSWEISAIPSSAWNCARFKQQPAGSALRPSR